MDDPPDPVRAPDRGRPGLVRRRGGGRGRGGGGPGRSLGLHQCGGRRGSGGHQHQLRPHRGPRPHPGGHRPRQVGHLQDRAAGWSSASPTRPRGTSAPGGGGRRRRRGLGPRQGLRLHLATGWPWEAGSSTCAPRPRPTASYWCRSTAATRATTPRPPWPRWRPSSAHRSTRTVVEEAVATVRCPGASRWWAATRWWWWTVPTTWPACWCWPRSLVEEFAVDRRGPGRGRHAARVGSGGHAGGAAGCRHPVGGGLRRRTRRGPCRPARWPMPPRDWAWSAPLAGSPAEARASGLDRAGPDDLIVVCGSLYVVADARRLLAHDAA